MMKSCACAAFAAATISALARIRPAVADVLADRAAEQEHVLADIGGLLAQRAARGRRDVLPVDGDRPAVRLVEPQDEVEHRGLAAAGRADQRRHLAGLGDERHAAQHRLARPIGELHVAEFDARVGDRQRRLVVVGRLGRRAVDDLEQHAHADQVAVELEIEAREPLRRLVGEQECRKEREELARRRAELDDAIAAIDDRGGDREAAERFHQRRGAVGDARPLVRLVLDLSHIGVEARAHLCLPA